MSINLINELGSSTRDCLQDIKHVLQDIKHV